MKPALLLVTLLAAGTLFPSAAQARTLAQARVSGTLNLYTSADFEPFNYLSADRKLTGFEVDLGNLIAQRLGLKAVWTVKDFDALLPAAETNPNVDLVIASHAITSTRARRVGFTSPHYCTGGVALTRAGGPTNGAAFGGRRVGADDGSTYLSYLKKLPGAVQAQGFQNSDGTFGALVSGRVDAVVTDRFAALAAVAKHPGQKLMVSPMLWKEQTGMVVAKNNTDLRLAVNAALAGLMADGSYARLSQAYFKQDIRC